MFLFSSPRNPIRNQRGFTLIEIIVTIIISAVLATILAQVMSGQTWRSYAPVQTIEENLALRAVMDNILSDYRLLRRTDPTPIDTLQSRVASGSYWGASESDPPAFTNGATIGATLKCIDFNTDNQENDAPAPNCDTLKITLTAAGTQHQLTALFTR